MPEHEEYLEDYPHDALFPPFLEQGSEGPAVSALHLFLISHGYTDPRDPIILDGQYGAVTEAAVQRLQEDLDFRKQDRDGKFGPATRAAVAKRFGLDFNHIPATAFDRAETTWYYNGEEQGSWATDEDDALNQINALLDRNTDADEDEDEGSDSEDPEDDSRDHGDYPYDG